MYADENDLKANTNGIMTVLKLFLTHSSKSQTKHMASFMITPLAPKETEKCIGQS